MSMTILKLHFSEITDRLTRRRIPASGPLQPPTAPATKACRRGPLRIPAAPSPKDMDPSSGTPAPQHTQEKGAHDGLRKSSWHRSNGVLPELRQSALLHV